MPTSLIPTPRDCLEIAPQLILATWGLIALILDIGPLRSATSDKRRGTLGLFCLAGCGIALATMLWRLLNPSGERDPFIFGGTIASDALTFSFDLLIILLMALVVGLSTAWNFTERWGEYFALLLWAGVGMMFLIAADELLTLFLSLETMTICLYLITGFETSRRRSVEGAMKYFVYGSVSSALFLFGLSLIYGLTGSTRLVEVHKVLEGDAVQGLSHNLAGGVAVLLLLVGFGFKVAAVPFHQWAPDAYEGAPAPVTAWVATGSKIASFVALMKVFLFALESWGSGESSPLGPGWLGLLAVISALTMTFGNFAALAQKNFKRMLAYSSISHAGYMLIGVIAVSASTKLESAGAVLFYLIIYGFTTVGTFAVAAWLARDFNSDMIDDLDGLGYRSPILAVCMVLLMLSLIGVPPTAGFFGKLYMFMEALNVDRTGPASITLVGLVALGLFNSVVSAFYYVRVLKAMFLRTGRGTIKPASRAIAVPVVIGTFVVIFFGCYPNTLLESMNVSAVEMLTSSTSGMIQENVHMNPLSQMKYKSGEEVLDEYKKTLAADKERLKSTELTDKARKELEEEIKRLEGIVAHGVVATPGGGGSGSPPASAAAAPGQGMGIALPSTYPGMSQPKSATKSAGGAAKSAGGRRGASGKAGRAPKAAPAAKSAPRPGDSTPKASPPK
jgi:NADH-quinone oxidoreductase subunit N